MKRCYLLASCVLAACFGAGPQPHAATDVQVVFEAPAGSGSCAVQSYVGDVVLAGTTGYAAVLPYLPPGCAQTGAGPQGDEQIVEFPLDASVPSGSVVQDLGMTSVNGPTPPRLGLDGGGSLVWLYEVTGISLSLGPPGAPVEGSVSGGAAMPFPGQPIQVWNDGGALDVAVTMPQGGQLPGDPAAPGYPCCGDNTPRADMVYRGPVTTGQKPTVTFASQQAVVAELKQPFAVDSGHTYYVGGIGTGWPIDELGSSSPVAMLSPSVDAYAPVGLAAQGGGLAIAVAPAILDNGPPPAPGCEITWFQPTANGSSVPSPSPILQTSRFSCMDVAIDPPYIYFAIVEAAQNGDCGNCGPDLHGAGIGRVSFDGQTFESLALGVSGSQSGPRRVYIAGGEIYAVDPLAIVRIDESKLAGAHDFTL